MVEEELISLESNSMNLEVRESEEVFEDDDLDPPCSKPAKKKKGPISIQLQADS